MMLRITHTFAVVIALTSGLRGIEAAQPCPLFWTRFQNQCYRLFSNDGVNINQAVAEPKCNQFSSCSGSLAHLPSASTPAEYDFLRVWLGGIIENLAVTPVNIGLKADSTGKLFGYDYTYINELYPHLPGGGSPSVSYVIDETGIATGTSTFYICKMNTAGNTNFKDLYFETAEEM
ncbi:uncharacterized protein LOC117108827 [Anneissia japonica]|uniref:uncharacterized protein LOC117108827 n=1 Tax=Anneissia japonica TaxID=1529436 RepID=UPI001425565E|nr:uncharacterized protein LOC117108827 [Anneissia japonica]